MTGAPCASRTVRWASTAVTLTVRSAPSRSMTTSVGLVPWAAIRACSSSQVETFTPPQETILSPTRMPAALAGPTGSESWQGAPASMSDDTQGATVDSVVVRPGMPTTPTATASSTIPRTRLVRIPPAITMSFLGTLRW